MVSRRDVLIGLSTAACLRLVTGCGPESSGESTEPVRGPEASTEPTGGTARSSGWWMPAEDEPHERTWMCWPSSTDIWGTDLGDVQDAIVRIALAIADFEPVSMLVRPEAMAELDGILGDAVELVEGPVDDLWARDTLPNFVIRDVVGGGRELAAAHARFNGWGGKQVHDGDAQLAALVADRLGIKRFESGLVGEGGAVEVDGRGAVLAAESCWVNENRNPGMTRDEIEAALLGMLGGDRLIWVDGLAGHDITDGHIDTLARFADPGTIVVDEPAFDDPDDPWVAVAERTREQVSAAETAGGAAYEVVAVVQPADIRGDGADFLSTYMNFYVCNGAVSAPEFGDAEADGAARAVLEALFPDREIVMLDIDALAAGGGGIHCATQQQPALA